MRLVAIQQFVFPTFFLCLSRKGESLLGFDALGRRFGSSNPSFLRRSLVGCCRTSRIGFRMQWFASGERGLRFCRTQRKISFRVDVLGGRFRRSSPVFWEDLLWVFAEHRGFVSECSNLLSEEWGLRFYGGPKTPVTRDSLEWNRSWVGICGLGFWEEG
jgi:hypothetical protein